jgi:hypothetical protein
MQTYWRLGLRILAAASSLACGLPPLLRAEDTKAAGDIPPIFSQTAAVNQAPPVLADLPAAPAPQREPATAMVQLISEGLPKFDARMAGQDAGQEQSTPVLMDPFNVFDSRVVELTRPRESLLDKLNSTDPVYRYAGKAMTSELTFVDLGTASNWRPFSIDPPPAISLRFTLSW